MIDLSTLLLFLAAGLALNLTPGADMLFCLGQGMKGGTRVGVAAAFGIATGSVVHVLLAAFGLAALLTAHPTAFEVLRWAGVVYLVYLAIRAILEPLHPHSPSGGNKASIVEAWWRGTLVNVFNPKVAIFILAFIPQFVDPQGGSTVVQFLIYGAIFNVTGTIVNGLVGAFAGSARTLISESEMVGRWLQRASATVFLLLAAKLAFEER